MRRTLTLLCLVLVAIMTAGYGQTGLGSIAGKVADTSGGVLPGVEVTATNMATDVKTQTITNEVGDYLVANLIPGKYTLTVGAPGFKTLQRDGLTVQVGDKLTLDLTLEVGEVSQTVNVTGEAPLLRSQDAETGEERARERDCPLLLRYRSAPRRPPEKGTRKERERECPHLLHCPALAKKARSSPRF